jgi:hypothetical protein
MNHRLRRSAAESRESLVDSLRRATETLSHGDRKSKSHSLRVSATPWPVSRTYLTNYVSGG